MKQSISPAIFKVKMTSFETYRKGTILSASQNMEYSELVYYYFSVRASKFCYGPVDFTLNQPCWLDEQKVCFNPCLSHMVFILCHTHTLTHGLLVLSVYLLSISQHTLMYSIVSETAMYSTSGT